MARKAKHIHISKTKKALISAFFVFVCFSSYGKSFCKLTAVQQWAVVEYINDGDTLTLANGDRVRLLGINTPEIDHQNLPQSQPFAQQARQWLQTTLGKKAKIGLVFDERKKDRFGRLLAHVVFQNQLVTEALLKQGLAHAYVIPPNQMYWQCLQQASQAAQIQSIGIWSLAQYQYQPAASLTSTAKDRFYGFIQGTVTQAGQSKKHLWFELDDKLWVGIKHADLKYFASKTAEQLKGSKLFVQGWHYFSHGKHRMKIRHQQAVAGW